MEKNGRQVPQAGTAPDYSFAGYARKPRFCSYWHQVDEVLAFCPKRVLLIGVGDGIVPLLIRHISPETAVDTFDYDASLKPDIVGDVREIASLCPKDGYDVILCSQVLEHLPYEEFTKILSAFGRIARHTVLSIPCQYHSFGFRLEVPKLHVGRIFYMDRLRGKPDLSAGHHWEAGTPDHPLKAVREDIKKVSAIKKEYRVEEKPWHLFFILENR